MIIRKSAQITSQLLGQINSSIIAIVLAAFMAVSLPSAFAAKPIAAAEVSRVVDINSASPEQIAQSLVGIGLKKAEAIVAYRTSKGKFKTVDDLLNVKGIGESTLNKNRSLIKI